MAHLIQSLNYFKDLSPPATLSPTSPPNNVQHAQHFFLFFQHAKLTRIQRPFVLAIPDAWYVIFLPPNHLELNSNVPSSMFPLTILAKVYSTSTFLIICIYFLPSIYAFLKLCIYSVFLCLFSNNKSPIRAKTFCISSVQDSAQHTISLNKHLLNESRVKIIEYYTNNRMLIIFNLVSDMQTMNIMQYIGYKSNICYN